MLTFLSQIDDLGLWLAAVVAGLAALGTAVRWIVRRTRRAWKALKPWVKRAQIVLEAAEVELRPNGGGSMKDRIASIPALHEKQEDLARRLEAHLEHATAYQAEIYARLGGIEETNDEQAAAIGHLADTLPRMAEALPVVARSLPHPADIAVGPETSPRAVDE